MSNETFAGFTDAELRDMAGAFDSAAGEGEFRNLGLAHKLIDEATCRQIKLPLAYDHGEHEADKWLGRSNVGDLG